MVLLDLLFPRICPVCKRILLRRERYICLECSLNLPLTYFWNWPDNPAEMLFWGRLNNVKAVCLYFYREGSEYKEIVHRFKYNREIGMGRFFSTLLGNKIVKSGRFQDIDYIVPVPLHWAKRWKRGFNQATVIADSIARVLNIPVKEGVLIRARYTQTQTKRGSEERWKNVIGAFRVKNGKIFEGKHILLVDDVLTTGATIEACGIHLQKIERCKVSVATLGFVE